VIVSDHVRARPGGPFTNGPYRCRGCRRMVMERVWGGWRRPVIVLVVRIGGLV